MFKRAKPYETSTVRPLAYLKPEIPHPDVLIKSVRIRTNPGFEISQELGFKSKHSETSRARFACGELHCRTVLIE